MTEPTRTHDLHTYKVLSPDWLTKHEPRVLEHMVTHPDTTYEMSVMSEIGDGVYIAWSTCSRCTKHYSTCSCPEGPLEPAHITRSRAARWNRSFDARPDLGHDRELTAKVVSELRDRGYVVGEIPEPVVKEVTVKVETDRLFIELFKAAADCEAPEGTQLDDVLSEFQERYDAAIGIKRDENGDLICQGCGAVATDGALPARCQGGVSHSFVPAEDVDPQDEPTLCVQCEAPLDNGRACPMTSSGDHVPADPEETERIMAGPDADDLDFARDTLGEEATDEEVEELADQRVAVREHERKLDDIQVDF
jgi:hypothetical protein